MPHFVAFISNKKKISQIMISQKDNQNKNLTIKSSNTENKIQAP